MLNIYKIVETKSGAEVYANFWSETYYRYGSLLKNYSGGSYPGVMYLKKTKDGYRVTKTRYAEDGESLEKSIWKLCKGYPDVAIRMMKEGCLSLPGIHENVKRPTRIHVRYQDENFVEHDEWVEGYLARVMQHEFDHLEGTVFVDRISPMRKQMIRGKLKDLLQGRFRCAYRTKIPRK